MDVRLPKPDPTQAPGAVSHSQERLYSGDREKAARGDIKTIRDTRFPSKLRVAPGARALELAGPLVRESGG